MHLIYMSLKHVIRLCARESMTSNVSLNTHNIIILYSVNVRVVELNKDTKNLISYLRIGLHCTPSKHLPP